MDADSWEILAVYASRGEHSKGLVISQGCPKDSRGINMADSTETEPENVFKIEHIPRPDKWRYYKPVIVVKGITEYV